MLVYEINDVRVASESSVGGQNAAAALALRQSSFHFWLVHERMEVLCRQRMIYGSACLANGLTPSHQLTLQRLLIHQVRRRSTSTNF